MKTYGKNNPKNIWEKRALKVYKYELYRKKLSKLTYFIFAISCFEKLINIVYG